LIHVDLRLFDLIYELLFTRSQFWFLPARLPLMLTPAMDDLDIANFGRVDLAVSSGPSEPEEESKPKRRKADPLDSKPKRHKAEPLESKRKKPKADPLDCGGADAGESSEGDPLDCSGIGKGGVDALAESSEGDPNGSQSDKANDSVDDSVDDSDDNSEPPPPDLTSCADDVESGSGDDSENDEDTEDAPDMSMGKARPEHTAMSEMDIVEGDDHMPFSFQSWEEHVGVGACGGKKSCARCLWQARRKAWQRRLAFEQGGQRKCPIVERPRSWGGNWAIGCVVCSQAKCTGAYAEFEIRTIKALQFCNLQIHCKGPSHLKALGELVAPPEMDIAAAPAVDVGDDAEWGPDVPGAPTGATFVHALTHFQECVSLRSTERLADAFNLLSQEGGIDGERRKIQTALRCCAEVVRQDNREHVKKCDDISVQADGRAAEHLMTALATDRETLTTKYFALGVKTGVTGGCAQITQATQDICKAFATEFAGELDADVFGKLVGAKSRVRSYESDGAADEQGAGRQLKANGVFPALDIVTREKAHAARGVVKEPYKFVPEIKHHLGKFVFDKGSILRQIDNSNVLQGFFIEEQKKRSRTCRIP